MTKFKTIGKVALCGVCATAFLHGQSNAQIVLTDGTSSAVYDPATVGGMTDWNVGGQDHLTSQSFWVRTASDTRERSLDEILINSGQTNPNDAFAAFGTTDYSIDITYALTELSVDSAQILESITLQNTSEAPLSLSFYQYNNFDLGANGSGDYARIIQNATSGLYSIAQGIEPGVAGILEDAEVAANPGASRAQVSFFNGLFLALEDGNVNDLSNYLGPIGPGNVEFAFQWDFTIDPGQSETISKVKTLDVTLIPEPTAAALAMLGLGALISRRYTKRG